MPSSWSPSLRFELQFTGENINLWGEKLNATLARADYAIAGWLTKAITGDYTLKTANAADDEARAAMIKFTGSLLGAASITLPPVSKSYFIYNATTVALTVTTGAGATITIDAGDSTLAFCDGANVHSISFGGLALKEYVGAVAASSGAVPGPVGQANKYLFSDGANVFWRRPAASDLSDYQTAILGRTAAMAIALSA